MFDCCIEVVRYLLTPALLLAVLAGFTFRRGRKLEFWFLAGTTFVGLAAAVGIYAAKRLHPKKLLNTLVILNRKIVAIAMVTLAVALLIFIAIAVISSIRSRKASSKTQTLQSLQPHLMRRDLPQGATARIGNCLFLFFGGLSLVAMLASTLPYVWLKTLDFVAFGEDSFGTASLWRVGGYILAFLTLFLATLSLYQLYKRLHDKSFYLFAGLMTVAIFYTHFMKGITALARLDILSTQSNFVFDIMIRNDQNLGLYAGLYLGVTVLTSLYVFFTHLKLRGHFDTPAARRKQRWWLRNCRRWSFSAILFVLLPLIAVTWILAYITKPVELTPPQEYQETDTQIIVPLTDVDDGHLHRFAYEYEGHNIRFIVVKKPQGNTFGLGLDACDICGVAGYYERNDDVICKRCDVIMNKATIGFKGGCNPVPFNYEIVDGRIIINKEVLQAEKDRFPIGR